jgi:glucose/arabinose dehydrogenase
MAIAQFAISVILNTLMVGIIVVTAYAMGDPPSVALIPAVSQAFESPIFVTHANDESGRIYIVEQSGKIHIVQDGRLLETPLLDISEQVLYGYECGLLGLAFHPQYRENGRFFVNYSTKDGCSTVVAEYRRSPDGTGAAREHKIILAVPQPHTNHNGGMLAFGPDGLLYIGMGDGGGIGDPQNRSQDLHDLLGKMLRIDVDRGLPYAVPPDNPFTPEAARAEIYAMGLRNPWRYSFDRKTGELWLADVGLKGWEEINVITKGGNYGWSIMEGSSCFKKKKCDTTGLIPPLIEYRHEDGRCSITGGYVYRGRSIPALVGSYLYGDYCSGEVFAVRTENGGNVTGKPWRLLKTEARISSFGEDEQGEMYLVDHRGTVYRLGPVGK